MSGAGAKEPDRMRFRPPRMGATLALIVAALPAGVAAHSGLASSSPAADAELDAPPERVTLVFASGLRPDGSGFIVTDARAASVGTGALDLTVADRNELSGTVAITESGVYRVAWTAVAADRHRETGELTFTVDIEPDGVTPPDTALSRLSGSLRTLGVTVLLGAAAVGLRRARRAPG